MSLLFSHIEREKKTRVKLKSIFFFFFFFNFKVTSLRAFILVCCSIQSVFLQQTSEM